MIKYNLELNENQIDVVMWALDLYSRLHCGQLSELRNLNKNNPEDKTLSKLHHQLFPNLMGLNSSYGIAGIQTPEEAKIAYDIYKQMHYIYNPVGVYAYKPRVLSKQGLPKFNKKEEMNK